MTGQSLKLGKFITDQVANTFGLVWWPSVILTPALPQDSGQWKYAPIMAEIRQSVRETQAWEKKQKKNKNAYNDRGSHHCECDRNKHNAFYFLLQTTRVKCEFACHLPINVYLYLSLWSMIILNNVDV